MSIFNGFFHHIPIHDKIEDDGLLGKKSQQILTNYMDSTMHYKGDIVVEESTQKTFVYLNNDCWLPISVNDNEKSDDNTLDKSRKVRSVCSHCGGVLVPNLHSEITVCDYCDCANSTFVYKTDPEFNKI